MNESERASYRILDAAANRASEGLRTLEEYARFVIEHTTLARSLKELRHALATAFAGLSREACLQSRDTESDVGTTIQASGEYQRDSIDSVVRAGVERVQQSLRVLEEYGKTVDADFARAVEVIRYRAYTIHRDLELCLIEEQRRARLAQAQLYVLVECLSSDGAFESLVRDLYQAGVDVIQLRDKRAEDRTLLQRATVGALVAADADALFVVNDRADIAVAASADGVHVGQTELPVKHARRIMGTNRLVGVSTHQLDQVHQAITDGADYIGCGPTFPSRTKSFQDFPGLAFLQAVHRETKAKPIPAFAIGGIDRTNLVDVLEAGFHRVAVTGAIAASDQPQAAARDLKQTLLAAQQDQTDLKASPR